MQYLSIASDHDLTHVIMQICLHKSIRKSFIAQQQQQQQQQQKTIIINK